MKNSAFFFHGNRLRLLALAGLSSLAAACSTSDGSDSEHNPPLAAPPEPVSAGPAEERPSVSTATPESALRDRKQSAYETIFGRTAAGEAFREGVALLQIVDDQSGPRVELTLLGALASEGGLRVRLELDGQALSETRALSVASLKSGQVQRSAKGIEGNVEAAVANELKRRAEPGRLPRLMGELVTSSPATSLMFDTQYSVECLVSPSTLGRDGNGHAGPTTQGRELVADAAFESEFCQRFAFLR